MFADGHQCCALCFAPANLDSNFRDQHKTDSCTASAETMRLEYSMAIVRMVNGISDKAQKGKTATSVSSNAAAAGEFSCNDSATAVTSVLYSLPADEELHQDACGIS